MLASSRVQADLGKSVGARDARNAEIPRACRNDPAIFAEGVAAIVRDGHHDAIAIVPDCVQRAVWTDDAVKTFQRAVVVTRQTGNAAQLDGLRPRPAVIRGAREHKVACSKSELSPADIKIAGVRPAGV